MKKLFIFSSLLLCLIASPKTFSAQQAEEEKKYLLIRLDPHFIHAYNSHFYIIEKNISKEDFDKWFFSRYNRGDLHYIGVETKKKGSNKSNLSSNQSNLGSSITLIKNTYENPLDNKEKHLFTIQRISEVINEKGRAQLYYLDYKDKKEKGIQCKEIKNYKKIDEIINPQNNKSQKSKKGSYSSQQFMIFGGLFLVVTVVIFLVLKNISPSKRPKSSKFSKRRKRRTT